MTLSMVISPTWLAFSFSSPSLSMIGILSLLVSFKWCHFLRVSKENKVLCVTTTQRRGRNKKEGRGQKHPVMCASLLQLGMICSLKHISMLGFECSWLSHTLVRTVGHLSYQHWQSGDLWGIRNRNIYAFWILSFSVICEAVVAGGWYSWWAASFHKGKEIRKKESLPAGERWHPEH